MVNFFLLWLNVMLIYSTNTKAPVTVACTLRAPGATWSTPWGCLLTQEQTTANQKPQATLFPGDVVPCQHDGVAP